MSRFIDEADRSQGTLLPAQLDEYVSDENPVRVMDAFVGELDLIGSGRYVSSLSASASSPSHRRTPYSSTSAKSCPCTPGAPLFERHWA